MTRGVAFSAQRCLGTLVLLPGDPFRHPAQGAADAMGRACLDRQERHARTPKGCAHALSRWPRSAGGPSPSRFTSWRATACALAAALALLLGAGAAQAQTSVKLVSNTGQSKDHESHHSSDRAQPFTTGSNAAGYTLTSVKFLSSGIDSSKTALRIESSGTNNKPGGSLGTLTLSHSGTTTTGTTTGIALDANTTYFVVLESSDGSSTYRRTRSDNEDAGAAAGWSIGDGSLWDDDSTLDWDQTSATSLQVAIHGYAKNNAPTVANAIPNQAATTATAFSYQFPANTFVDADTGTTLTYTATKSDDMALPSWLTFDANTRTFSGTPATGDIGTVSVKVTASDGAASVSDTFDIVVANAVPMARAGADRTVEPGATVTLNGAGTDPDGSTLSYAWSQISGTSVTLQNANTARATFIAPDAAGALVFRLTVTDDIGATDTDDVTVTVRAALEEQQRAVTHALAAVASRTAAGAVANIGTRLGDAVPPAGLTLAGRPMSFGGSDASGPDCAAGCEPGAESWGMEAGELLGSSAFSLALGAADDGKGFDPAALRWGVWGRGDYGAFEGRPDAVSSYKGDMRTGWLGADAQAGRWVAGLAVSRGWSETDYALEGEKGRIETALTALWPYGRWTFANGLELRGLAGAGNGTARHVPEGNAPRERSRLAMRAGALGVRQAFAPLDGFDLAARADASFARMETAKGEEAVDGLRADSWRLRGGLEASRRFALPDGAALSPFAALAARRDGGDGPAGSGIELAGGLRYAAAGVSVEARGRWLAAHSEKGVRERGLSATVRLDPEAGGRGLSLSLTPRWGAQAGGAGALWREDAPQASGASEDAGALDARLGYGFALAPAAGGLLTPFAEAGLAGADDRRLRLGTRFEARGGALALELAGERRESAGARPEHTVRLELRVGF